MFEGNPFDAQMVKENIDAQMIGGNDALYTVTSDLTKENKRYKCKKYIWKKQSN